jgi:hypothetical protein
VQEGVLFFITNCYYYRFRHAAAHHLVENFAEVVPKRFPRIGPGQTSVRSSNLYGAVLKTGGARHARAGVTDNPRCLQDVPVASFTLVLRRVFVEAIWKRAAVIFGQEHSMRGLEDFQRNEMRNTDPRVNQLLGHVRQAANLLEQLMLRLWPSRLHGRSKSTHEMRKFPCSVGTLGAIVMFLVDSRIDVMEQCATEMRLISSVHRNS